MAIHEFFGKELKVINMGLESFANDLRDQKVETVHMNWKPPAGGNKKMMALLSKLK